MQPWFALVVFGLSVHLMLNHGYSQQAKSLAVKRTGETVDIHYWSDSQFAEHELQEADIVSSLDQ